MPVITYQTKLPVKCKQKDNLLFCNFETLAGEKKEIKNLNSVSVTGGKLSVEFEQGKFVVYPEPVKTLTISQRRIRKIRYVGTFPYRKKEIIVLNKLYIW
jgi:hypothetical protein